MNPGILMALCMSAAGFLIYLHALVTS